MKTTIPIPDWRITDFSPGEGAQLNAFAVDFDDSNWLPAVAPGDVHSTLLATGRIEDPFYDQNETKCAWIEEREWWYRTTITPPAESLVPGERFELAFDGLDTYATLWLNGEPLGRARNMFHAQVFDVTDRIAAGEANTIAICFDRPLDHIDGFDVSHWWERPGAPRVAMRKAQYGYGWDWGPRLPTIGIWQEASLNRLHNAALRGVHFSTVELNRAENVAIVAIKVEARAFVEDRPLRANLTLSRGDVMLSKDFLLQPLAIAAQLQPHDGGRRRTSPTKSLPMPPRPISPLRIPISGGRGTWANRSFTRSTRSSKSTIHRLIAAASRSASAPSCSTSRPTPTSRVRASSASCSTACRSSPRGPNWIPAHSFVATVTSERYADLIAAASRQHEHAARLGRRHLRGRRLLRRLRRAGPAGLAGLHVRLRHVSRGRPRSSTKLRRRRATRCAACATTRRLALWCGNNENQWLHDTHQLGPARTTAVPGALYYDQILPEAVAALDGRTPYWPGSPFGGNDHNSMDDGDRPQLGCLARQLAAPLRRANRTVDQHAGGVSYRRYAEDMGRFISEFGMHAAPVIDDAAHA